MFSCLYATSQAQGVTSSRVASRSGAEQNCGEGVRVSCLVQVSRYEKVFQQTFVAPF